MKLKKVSSATPVMMPGQNQRQQHQPAERRLPREARAVEHERAGHPDHERDATASSASLRLASAASSMPRSCASATNHLSVPSRSGHAMIGESWKA